MRVISPGCHSPAELAAWVKLLNGQSDSPHHLRRTMMLDACRLLTVVLVGAPAEPAFTPDDHRALDRMMPLIGSVVMLREKVDAAQARWQALAETLDRLTVGVVLANPQGGVLVMNQSAEEILQSALQRGDGKDEDAASLVRRLMDRGPAGAGQGRVAAGGPATLALPRDTSLPVTVLLAPVTGGARGQPAEGPFTALFLCDPERSLAGHEDSLRVVFGLTRLEAKIVVNLVNGLSPEECAQQLRISVHTIRAYLKQIFSKTGTHRQANLIRLVLASFGGLRAQRADPHATSSDGQAIPPGGAGFPASPRLEGLAPAAR
ncbi:helix-turn-helix transcriptional regulator [Azospirillum thermophilum]|nr:LuxR C-terminal-related transcriptional regulator [Azospirillum thermophilum]